MASKTEMIEIPADKAYELGQRIVKLEKLLRDHGICEDCGELYDHHIDEPFASCDCKQAEWYEGTPHMKQVKALVNKSRKQDKIILAYARALNRFDDKFEYTGTPETRNFVKQVLSQLTADIEALNVMGGG